MNYLPLNIVTSVIRKWVMSCHTYEQLLTCERIITNLQDRDKEPTYKTCISVLTQCLQIKRLGLQVFNKVKDGKTNR